MFLVGRGLADITGEAAGCGMLGYGRADQQTEGIHTRQRSRAFVLADGLTAPRPNPAMPTDVLSQM